MESRRPGKLELLVALTSTLLMLWLTLPEHQRQLLTMQAAAAGRDLAGRLARAQGHAGMGDELDGHARARQHYGAAYRLSRLRDHLAAQLDRLRP
jgi:hypothetical protein